MLGAKIKSKMGFDMTDIFQVLRSRELLEQSTCQEILQKNRRVYCGIDPSADSLHLGNLIGLVVLKWFQLYGYTPVIVLGGATGMIGDPSGKSKERILLDPSTINQNIQGIEKIVKNIFTTEADLPQPLFFNNYEWFSHFNFIDFLRDVGKYFRMGTMLAKESVQTRLRSEEGLSFTEFCYQTLQGYDFFHLFHHHHVAVQCGGSDQWGNILAGCDLIAKKSSSSQLRLENDHFSEHQTNFNDKPIGMVWPLLVRSDGRKFGKSEEGAIWLSADKLSEYDFYQHLLKTPDKDVISFMKKLTFMPLEEIDNYEKNLLNQLDLPNTAQKRFAQELTKFIHGETGLRKALETTEAAKPGTLSELKRENLEQLESQIPCFEISLESILTMRRIDLLEASGLTESKASARRLIENRGAYLNQKVIENSQQLI